VNAEARSGGGNPNLGGGVRERAFRMWESLERE
jgi:hypothetical protein